MAGFEPTTSASRTQRSTKLSHIPMRIEILPEGLTDKFSGSSHSWWLCYILALMDLEICPKCGINWNRWNRCPSCGFVPIGVGLDKLPKKKRKRVRKYVEPGSGRGFLTTMLLFSIGTFAYMYKPWEDDWELMRRMVGQGRYHSIVGKWQISKSITHKINGESLFGHPNIDKAVIQFTKSGVLKMVVAKNENMSQASGQYEQKGLKLLVDALAGDTPTPLPNTLSANLAWVGADMCVANIKGHETIYLRRRKKSVADSTMAQKFSNLDIPKSMDDAPAGGIRGWIGTYSAAG